MKLRIMIMALIGLLAVSGCASTSGIKKYAESASSFNGPTQLIEHNYPMEDMYRIYKKGGSAFSSTEQLKTHLEKKIIEFAKNKGRSFVILGQRVTTGTVGRFSRVEIVFALTDKK